MSVLVQSLLQAKKLKPTYFSQPRNLYETLFVLPKHGVSFTVAPVITKPQANHEAVLWFSKDAKLDMNAPPVFQIVYSKPKSVCLSP